MMELHVQAITAICVIISLVSSNATDTCTSYEPLPLAAYRGGNCPYDQDRDVCDRNLNPDAWYQAIGLSGYLSMQESPADFMKCGTTFPIWMNGTHPAVAEGVVERQTCQTNINSSCFESVTIKVKNCGMFYVYQMSAVGACKEAYCFGENEACPPYDDPCVSYESLHRAAYRGGKCPYEQGRDVCDRFLNPNAWYQAVGHSGYLTMQESPAEFMKCGTNFPIWMNGTHPAVNDGVVERQTCQRSIDNICAKSGTIKVKNCDRFYVYQMPFVDACSAAYCFGENDACPAYDPCDVSEHLTIPYDIARSSSCEVTDESTCDSFTSGAWYKFKGKSGFLTVASSCPSATTCGAQSPLWISHTEAEYTNGTRIMSVCVRNATECCAERFSIESKQCTDFTVYRFGAVFHEQCRRFCTEDPAATCSSTNSAEDEDGPHATGESKEKNGSKGTIIWLVPALLGTLIVGLAVGVIVTYFLIIRRKREKVGSSALFDHFYLNGKVAKKNMMVTGVGDNLRPDPYQIPQINEKIKE